ncbi:MAG: hypothetical protein KDB80_16030 [Planctomycetes bacterium]|nr:hypothetical protein [Planctomycetota bacterium]
MHRYSFASFVLASVVVAQTPSLELDGGYHVGQIGIEIPNPSSLPGAVENVMSMRGTLLVHPDLTWSSTQTEHRVDELLQVTHQVTGDAGTYALMSDSALLLDANPSMPGTDITWLGVKPDATVLLGVNTVIGPVSWIRICIQSSSGRQYSDLSGSYHVASVRYAYGDPNGIVTITQSGIGTFDGVGSVSFTGSEQEVDSLGSITNRAASFSGAYTITTNGGLNVGGTLEGGFSANGDLFFVVGNDPASMTVELTVGVRVGPAYDFADFPGKWGTFDHALEIGHLSNPTATTTLGLVELVDTSATTGSFTGTLGVAESSPAGTNSSMLSWNGTATLGAMGQVTYQPTTGLPVTYSFAPDGDFYIGIRQLTVANLSLGMRVCAGSNDYGSGTVGTGGEIPVQVHTGFPYLGNADFGIKVVNGLPGASAGMLITLGAWPGIPFLGGTIWVDPGRLIAVPSRTLSPSGDATWDLPLPTNPIWLSHDLYTQVLVIDPGAPGGLAMTSGLQTVFCR